VSKYFNETQKTDQWLEQDGAGKRQDLAAIIDDLRAPKPAAPELPRPPRPAPVEEPYAPHVPHVQAAPEKGEEVLRVAASPVVLSGLKSGHYAMEAYRALRTRLMRLQSSKGLRSVVLSSTIPGEGKTITALNLGLCYAQLHAMSVLLIDADLRTKRLTQFFENTSGPGVSEVMSGQAGYEDVIRKTEIPNLYVVPAGSAEVSPPELFAGATWTEFVAKCKEKFKMILVDAPPARPLADFELICSGCDGFLMVVRAHHTQREVLQQTASQVDAKKLLGLVLNSTEVHSKNSYYSQFGSNSPYGSFAQS